MPHVVCTALGVLEGPHIEIFEKNGFRVSHTPPGKNLWQEADLVEVLQNADACVAGSEPYTRSVFEKLPKLRVIARRGVGFDAIDLKAADEHNVVVTTTPGTLHHSVAEHTIALLFGLVRGFPALDQNVRVGNWKRTSTPRLMGKNLGIIGLGQIGQAVASRAVGLGMKVLAYDPFPNHEFAKKWGIEFLSMDEVLRSSFFVSLHLPYSAEMKHLINSRTLSLMPKGSYLINTARGPIVNEVDLCAALESGHLAGAGLDVFENEPLPLSSPLLKFSNVLLSGHVAGADNESNHDICTMFAETVVELHRGGWPVRCIRNMAGRSDWKW